ncbi:hypothetical protein Micbo1qcDRAFT_159030 [Microdochium bolleyi]|uniref:RBR-type E3 ubiquitin transferase n=1 Tax=Microdochium bolleyi TaxID=196109 RepID=A0A136JAA1_9PEZI|nr:hypothetical protein Micbo1qcDRAFT_159030 [Microdochium bolleyi]
MAVSVQMPVAATDMGRAPVTEPPPELPEHEFLTEVLQLPSEDFEAYLEGLMKRAAQLGISVSRPNSSKSFHDKRNTSGADSSVTIDTNHVRTVSTSSQESADTAITSHSSKDGVQDASESVLSRTRPHNLTFAQYEAYLQQPDKAADQPKFLSSPPTHDRVPASVFSMSTRKSYKSIKLGLSKMRRKRKTTPSPEFLYVSCSACREDPKENGSLVKLPCGHSYCSRCLRIMVNQATSDESKMPPRCCTQPIPSSVIKPLLDRNDQAAFLKAVVQFSTPWEARVFCSNPTCGEFIPPRSKVDPRHPFHAVCRACRTRVCVMCKRDAHPIGQDCPSDWELDAVLKMGEKSGWRRCYKCRTLVELSQGCTHMTCRCRAEFCYICGAVWDQSIGCPNLCNGEAEMERRREEEEARDAAHAADEALRKETEAQEARERLEAEQRTLESVEFKTLREEQVKDLERFRMFERKSRWHMWARHAQQKLALIEKQSSTLDKMKERHLKTMATLEDRQVNAEMELRASLEQSERNVRTRLKHMEAYCDGLGQKPEADMPSRVVTERDLRELAQQYNLERNMKQLHEARINVMRDRQTSALEELNDRQEQEMAKLLEKHNKELEQLESGFADEEETASAVFLQRRALLQKRWTLCAEIMRKELESEKGLRFAALSIPEWPVDPEASEDGLSAVEE